VRFREGRVARAKVVDGQTDAELSDRAQARIDQPDVRTHDHALCHLEFEAPRRQSAIGERAVEELDQIVVSYLRRREGDRDDQVSAFVLPGLGLPPRLLQHPPSERQNEPRRLGHRDERAWQNLAASRVLPADQRFDAAHATTA